ncbi:MAG: hypothetical protein LUP91_06705 [Methylococcaceae bacterium]|nr:hypothetical protein [Methylococcaceae bacterium]
MNARLGAFCGLAGGAREDVCLYVFHRVECAARIHFGGRGDGIINERLPHFGQTGLGFQRLDHECVG